MRVTEILPSIFFLCWSTGSIETTVKEIRQWPVPNVIVASEHRASEMLRQVSRFSIGLSNLCLKGNNFVIPKHTEGSTTSFQNELNGSMA